MTEAVGSLHQPAARGTVVMVAPSLSRLSRCTEALVALGFELRTESHCAETQLSAATTGDAEVILIEPADTEGGCVELVRIWRRRAPAAAIIALVESTSPSQVDEAFVAGADDVMPMPCAPTDLAIRVQVARQRLQARRPPLIVEATLLTHEYSAKEVLRLYRTTRILSVHDRHVLLTPRECHVMVLLLSRAGQSVSRNELLSAVWGREYLKALTTNVVDAYIRLLRKKLLDIRSPSRIVAVRHVGYRIDGHAMVE